MPGGGKKEEKVVLLPPPSLSRSLLRLFTHSRYHCTPFYPSQAFSAAVREMSPGRVDLTRESGGNPLRYQPGLKKANFRIT